MGVEDNLKTHIMHGVRQLQQACQLYEQNTQQHCHSMIHGGRCAVKENKPDRTVTRVNINYNSTVDGIISERPVAYYFFCT